MNAWMLPIATSMNTGGKQHHEAQPQAAQPAERDHDRRGPQPGEDRPGQPVQRPDRLGERRRVEVRVEVGEGGAAVRVERVGGPVGVGVDRERQQARADEEREREARQERASSRAGPSANLEPASGSAKRLGAQRHGCVLHPCAAQAPVRRSHPHRNHSEAGVWRRYHLIGDDAASRTGARASIPRPPADAPADRHVRGGLGRSVHRVVPRGDPRGRPPDLSRRSPGDHGRSQPMVGVGRGVLVRRDVSGADCLRRRRVPSGAGRDRRLLGPVRGGRCGRDPTAQAAVVVDPVSAALRGRDRHQRRCARAARARCRGRRGRDLSRAEVLRRRALAPSAPVAWTGRGSGPVGTCAAAVDRLHPAAQRDHRRTG